MLRTTLYANASCCWKTSYSTVKNVLQNASVVTFVLEVLHVQVVPDHGYLVGYV